MLQAAYNPDQRPSVQQPQASKAHQSHMHLQHLCLRPWLLHPWQIILTRIRDSTNHVCADRGSTSSLTDSLNDRCTCSVVRAAGEIRCQSTWALERFDGWSFAVSHSQRCVAFRHGRRCDLTKCLPGLRDGRFQRMTFAAAANRPNCFNG
jgi:hypothetical protein